MFFLVLISFPSTCAELGPYTLDFTPNGRYMAAAGRKGHLAIVDMKTLNLIKEIQVCTAPVKIKICS